MNTPKTKESSRTRANHGMRGTRFYKIWENMKSRCLPKHKNAHIYAQRGIRVCKRWASFVNFRDDMLASYEQHYAKNDGDTTIDRIDGTKGYYPSNCRWATRKVQTRNMKRNINITINGVTKCLTDWAEENGISGAAARNRYFIYGWDPVDAVTRPMRPRRYFGNKRNTAITKIKEEHEQH